MIEQYLWQTHYQILSITFLKEFIKLNVNTDTMIKNVELAVLNINIATAFLNTQTYIKKFFKQDNNKSILLLSKGGKVQ